MCENWGVKFYDLTLPLHNQMLVWEGDPGVNVDVKTTVEENGVRLSYFSFSSHTGTHIDAPNHFLKNSKVGVDGIALEKLVGPCLVIDLTMIDHSEITIDDIASSSIKKGSRILFKTGNFKLLKKPTFPKNYISLSLEAARYLVKKGVCLVGTDFLGIEKRKNPGHPVHTTLLKADIVIVEGLDLAKVPAGKYQLVCLPLRVVDADGSPVRVILIK